MNYQFSPDDGKNGVKIRVSKEGAVLASLGETLVVVEIDIEKVLASRSNPEDKLVSCAFRMKSSIGGQT
jgi:hypothetical protein